MREEIRHRSWLMIGLAVALLSASGVPAGDTDLFSNDKTTTVAEIAMEHPEVLNLPECSVSQPWAVEDYAPAAIQGGAPWDPLRAGFFTAAVVSLIPSIRAFFNGSMFYC